jgi:hypothetical protein
MDRITKLYTLTKRLIIMTAASLVIFSALFAVSFFFSDRFMVTWAVFLCGIIGGFVSIQQRIKTVTDDELSLLTKSWFQILLVPVFGGVFSLVLYSLFLSGIISGNLFPAFYIPEPSNKIPDATFIIDFFTKTYPATGQDFSKLLFWSFVAGFSERFVPQIITSVSDKVTTETDNNESEQHESQGEAGVEDRAESEAEREAESKISPLRHDT